MQKSIYQVALICAVVGYSFTFVTYIPIIIELLAKGQRQKAYELILFAIGFLVITVHVSKQLAKVYNSREVFLPISDISEFPASLGYGILALYMALVINKDTHVYYILALFGYTLLAAKQTFGVFFVIAFCTLSIMYHIYDNSEHRISMICKFLMSLYMGVYAYAYIHNIK